MMGFTIYMAVKSFATATKSLDEFMYISGEVYETQMVKHIMRRKKSPDIIEDVLVLRIGGSDEKFGFRQGTNAFKQLLGFNKIGKKIHIHYDPNAGRIEEGVTLAIFNLKIGQANVIDFADSKKYFRNLSIFFFILTAFLVALTVRIIKRIRMGKIRSWD